MDFQFINPASTRKKGDGIELYARSVLSLGLFYWEYSDSIREGDGERLLRCWRYMLPIFTNAGRRNYAIEAFRLLYQHEYQLTQRQATQLLYSRFVNVQGLPGHNVASDLHMEHLNAICKGCVKDLGANKTEVAIQRSAKALGTIVPVLEKFDEQNNMPGISGAHKRASEERDQAIVVNQLLKTKVFAVKPGRKHKSFPKPKNALGGRSEIKAWIIDRL